MKICYILAFVLLSFQNGLSQFKVNSFTPTTESTSVALTSDIVITFSDSLSHNESIEKLQENIIGIPIDSISVNSLTISEDRKTLTFNVTHTPNTDFSWVIVEAKNTKGEFIDKTYSFNYTTSSAFAPFSISGNLYQRSLFWDPVSKTSTSMNKLNLNWFKSFKSNAKKASSNNATSLDYSRGLILLTTVIPNFGNDNRDRDDNGNREENGDGDDNGDNGDNEDDGPPEGLVAVSSINENGEFVIPHVKTGTYYVTALLFKPKFDDYHNEDIFDIYAIGFLDTNQDYEPDSFIVENESITGLQIGVMVIDDELNSVVINDIYSIALNQIKADFGSTSTVLIIFGEESSYNNYKNSSATFSEMPVPKGTSANWMFGFYAPDSNKIYSGAITPFGMQYQEEDISYLIDEFDFQNAVGIDAVAMNSDEAIQIAEASGGATFRANVPENAYYDLEFYYSNYPELKEELPAFTNKNPFWGVEYSYYQHPIDNQEGVHAQHLVIIDAVTKEILYSGNKEVAIEDQLTNLTSYKLNQNYPNPFNPSTTIAFSLPVSSNVSLTIYNSLGQIVSVLTQQNYSAGTHSVAFDASKLSSGVYFYQLQTPSFVETKKMMLVK